MANYVLGRGRVMFDPFTAGTVVTAATFGTGERYLGNTTEFNITTESTKLDHFNSDAGLRVKDKSVVLEVNRTGNIICDDISLDNLAAFFLGDVSTVTQTSSTGSTSAFAAVQADRYYQLGQTSTTPAGVKDVASVVVTNTATPATTYVAGTDYTVNLELGRIYIIAGGACVGQGITVTYNRNATTFERVATSSSVASIEGALRFISENAEGVKRDIYFPYVKLAPSGDFALKGDDWQQLAFDIEILQKADGVAAMYIDGRPA